MTSTRILQWDAISDCAGKRNYARSYAGSMPARISKLIHAGMKRGASEALKMLGEMLLLNP